MLPDQVVFTGAQTATVPFQHLPVLVLPIKHTTTAEAAPRLKNEMRIIALCTHSILSANPLDLMSLHWFSSSMFYSMTFLCAVPE